MQRSVEPVSAPISCEHTAGAVGSMSRRGKADDEMVGIRISEIRHRPSPILTILKSLALFNGNLLTPAEEPWTAFTADDLGIQQVEVVHSVCLCATGAAVERPNDCLMPIYEYEPVDHECLICNGRFEALQSVQDSPYEYCPTCGMPVIRVISRLAAKTEERQTLHDRAAKKGLTTFRRAEKGKWEKIAGDGVDMIVGTQEDIAKVESEKKGPIDIDKEG